MTSTVRTAPFARPAMAAAVLAAVAALLLGACMSPDQQRAFDLVNADRARVGLPALAPYGELEAKAQAWAQQLARDGYLHHSDLASGITAPWRSLGENVGVGSSVDQVDAAYLASAPHRANLLSPTFRYLGTGVARAANGRVYTVQEFMLV